MAVIRKLLCKVISGGIILIISCHGITTPKTNPNTLFPFLNLV